MGTGQYGCMGVWVQYGDKNYGDLLGDLLEATGGVIQS